MDEKTKQAIALGREQYEKRNYDKAEQHLATVIDSGHAYADVYNMIGVIHHDRGRLEEARDAFLEALKLNERYTEAALNLAVTYNDLGDYEGAQRVYRKTIGREAGAETIDPYAKGKIANLHAELAQAYLDIGLANEAIQEYRNAIRLCPEFADLRERLAGVYRQVGDTMAAAYELREAIRVKPGYHRARVALGVVLLITGQRRNAIEEWEEVLRLDPDNKAAKMYLRMALDPPIKSDYPTNPD